MVLLKSLAEFHLNTTRSASKAWERARLVDQNPYLWLTSYLILLWSSAYLSCRRGQVFQECPLHGCTAQCDHLRTSTARSHPAGGSLPSPATGSYASETSHSEFS